MTAAHHEPGQDPTFLFRGQRFLWGYSPDRQFCGMWDVENPDGEPTRLWPISEHTAAWDVFRDAEPHAVSFEETAPATHSDRVVRDADDDFAALDSSSFDASAFGAKRRSVLRLRRVSLVVALVAAVVAGGVFGASKLLSKSPAAVSPAQAVLTAATTTEALRTAHTSMTVTVRGIAGSGPVTATGTGAVDFTKSAGSMTLTIEGQKVSVLSVGGTLYENLPTISRFLPGKTWLSVPEGSSGMTSGGVFSAGDPSQMLHLLQAQGNVVVPTGAVTLGGVPVNGYSVIINKAAVESQLTSSGLPAAVVQSAEQFLKQVGTISYKLYIDSANQLRSMDFTMSVPTGSQTVSVSASVVLSQYGVPVNVAVPPAAQVASLQEFLGAASKAGS